MRRSTGPTRCRAHRSTEGSAPHCGDGLTGALAHIGMTVGITDSRAASYSHTQARQCTEHSGENFLHSVKAPAPPAHRAPRGPALRAWQPYAHPARAALKWGSDE